MKNLKKIILGAVFGLSLALGTSHLAEAAEMKYISVTETVAENQVTLEWNNMKADYYKVFKLNKKDKYIEQAQISGKRKFVDKKVKKDKGYSYKIVGYKKKKGKYKAFCEEELSVNTGYRHAWFDNEELCCNTKNTPSYIVLEVNTDTGVTASSHVIYRRKAGTKKWTKIKTVKESKKIRNHFSYTDKKVEAGQTYEYRVKTYWKQKGKKTKSIYSGVQKRYAVNDEEHVTLQMEMLTPDQTDTNTLTFKLSNDKNNGVMLFDEESGSYGDEDIEIRAKDGTWWDEDKNGYEYEYSNDGVTWNSLTEARKKGVALKPGKEIYLRLKFKNNKMLHYYLADYDDFKLTFSVTYCNHVHRIITDVLSNKVSFACSDFEH